MSKNISKKFVERVVNSSLEVFTNKYMNRTLKLFGRFFVFTLTITIFSLAVFTFSSTQVYAEGSFVFTSHLELGVVGNDVKELQILLNSKGYDVGIPDGKFGPTTKEQVILFQKANGLTPDGIIGQRSQAFLNGTSTFFPISSLPRTLKLLTPRMSGDDVKALQIFLNNSGYNTGTPDGVFGSKTEAQVKLFQIANNLIPDGKAGKNTLAIISQSSTSNSTSNQTSTLGCTSSIGFSTITGKSCVNTSIVSTIGCVFGALFNTITGASCKTLSVLPTGCSSSLGFSTTLGVSCSTGLLATQTFLSVVSGWHSGPSIHTISPTISGVTIPAQGEAPISTLADTTQYSATIAWTGTPSVFFASTSYTATITLTPKTGYTLTGVPGNFFTVAGAIATNDINSGVITAVFPSTPLIQLTISTPTLTTTKVYNANTTAVVTAGTLVGILAGDTVTVSAVANYDTALVGTGKTITTVYTLGGAQAGNYIKPINDINNTGVITAIVINTAAISGVTVPVVGATPVATLTDGTEYTATISWSPSGSIFGGDTVYTATITLTAKTGYTLSGVTANFFTVAGTSTPATNSADSGVVTAIFPITATPPPATTPSSIVLAVGSTAPVGGVTNVAIPAAGGTDTTGVITGYVATTADKIKFTVTNGGAAASTITINGGAYTSGADYQIVPTTSLPTIVVTTTETGKATGVRTFVITGPILGADGLTYGVVLGADGKRWLDRNLGATQVATSSTDYLAYGSFFQWGRPADGHQLINHTSATAATAVYGSTTTLSATDTPGNNLFITTSNDWRSTQNNNLWQGVNGVNNVCPAGFRLPTNTEQQTLITAAGITNSATAYSSTLKLTVAGCRSYSDASMCNLGYAAYYWSSSVSGTSALTLGFDGSSVYPAYNSSRGYGDPVRCFATAQLSTATTPSSIVLAVGSTAPVGGVTNVAIPSAWGTDTTGVVTGYVATTADKIKFTVTNGGAAASTITINGGAYTSGADYQIVPTTSLPTIVVTTTEAGKITTVRTFVITGPILGADGLTYGIVMGADGKKWLDRNLGATQVATSATDYQAYGSLFQWGRGADGHQLITHTSATAATAVNGSTTTLSVTDTPGDNLYIIKPASPFDWRNPPNSNLWQGVNGTNNVCPAGFRLPTSAEYVAMVTAASITNSATAYSSSLKFTLAGDRGDTGLDATLTYLGVMGFYWSSSVSGTSASDFSLSTSTANSADVDIRSRASSVRCFKN